MVGKRALTPGRAACIPMRGVRYRRRSMIVLQPRIVSFLFQVVAWPGGVRPQPRGNVHAGLAGRG